MHFCVNDTAATEIYTLSLHDALPISIAARGTWSRTCRPLDRNKPRRRTHGQRPTLRTSCGSTACACGWSKATNRSEEHTSELQSRQYLVCGLLLEKNTRSEECWLDIQ